MEVVEERCKMSRSLLVLAVLAGFLPGATVLADTVLLPEIGDNSDTITFDSADFANDYEVLSGIVNDPSGALGYSFADYASIGGSGNASASAALKVSFSSNLVNGDGTDLWLYKIGNRETFNLTIGNVTQETNVAWTFETAKPHGYDVNLVKIDLTDFGFGTGDTGLDYFVMSSWYKTSGRYWTTPDLGAAVAAFRDVRVAVVPLPAAGLSGFGLLACAMAARALRRRRR
jgi:hypothetical protein